MLIILLFVSLIKIDEFRDGSTVFSRHLNRFKSSDLLTLFGNDVVKISEMEGDPSFFAPDRFARTLHCNIANLLGEVLVDDQFACAPAFVKVQCHQKNHPLEPSSDPCTDPSANLLRLPSDNLYL